MKIDTQALSQWLHSHKGKDINQLLTKAVTHSYVEAFPEQIVSKHIIKRGQYFLSTVVGNDITIVKHQKTVKQMPDGRMLPCKFIETVVDDCDELYNTLLEGCYLIPQNFMKN